MFLCLLIYREPKYTVPVIFLSLTFDEYHVPANLHPHSPDPVRRISPNESNVAIEKLYSISVLIFELPQFIMIIFHKIGRIIKESHHWNVRPFQNGLLGHQIKISSTYRHGWSDNRPITPSSDSIVLRFPGIDSVTTRDRRHSDKEHLHYNTKLQCTDPGSPLMNMACLRWLSSWRCYLCPTMEFVHWDQQEAIPLL